MKEDNEKILTEQEILRLKEMHDETERRASNYTDENWEKIQAEANELLDNIANMMDRDVSDKEVQDLIHKKRMHICRYYYDCSVETYGRLGKTYSEDEVFAKTYENKKKGLAKFMGDAIAYYTEKNLGK